jgi:hypothetical protein
MQSDKRYAHTGLEGSELRDKDLWTANRIAAINLRILPYVITTLHTQRETYPNLS